MDGRAWVLQNGELSWWKKKEDAASGAPPQKDARVPLSKYRIVKEAGAASDKYFVFKIEFNGSAAEAGS